MHFNIINGRLRECHNKIMQPIPSTHRNLSQVMRKPTFSYAKTKTQISFAVTAKLVSAFVFATRIVQSIYFLNTKFQASSHLLWLYSPVSVGPGRKPRRPVFSQRGSIYVGLYLTLFSVGVKSSLLILVMNCSKYS